MPLVFMHFRGAETDWHCCADARLSEAKELPKLDELVFKEVAGAMRRNILVFAVPNVRAKRATAV